MKTKDCIKMLGDLRKLREATSIALPTKVSFAIVRNIRQLEPIVEDYESCYRELIVGNGKPDPDNPGIYAIDDDKFDYVNEQISQMKNMEHDVDVHYVSIDDLRGMDLSVDYMDALYDMLLEGD